MYNPVHHKVSPGGLRRSKCEAHITKKRRITTQTSMSYPGFERRLYSTAVSVTNHYTGWARKKNVKFGNRVSFLLNRDLQRTDFTKIDFYRSKISVFELQDRQ
ncbi:hypothetical protein TNCV_1353801 [Trichonephila clavipes]|nr:hypothetical protein TNCV_1353801 [Trichonephila clavipes]